MTAEPRVLRTDAEQGILAAFDQVADRLPGDAYVRGRRALAMEYFRRNGLPHRRIEAWKYTDLRTQVRIAAPPRLLSGLETDVSAILAQSPVGDLDRVRIVVADGIYRPELSDLIGLAGVRVRSLGLALEEGDRRIGGLFEEGVDPALSLNTAFVSGGLFVEIEEGALVGQPIEIAYVITGSEPAAVAVRSVVTVAAGASVRILESFAGPSGPAHQVNAVTELAVGDGAEVTWVRVQAEGSETLHLGSLVAEIGTGAVFRQLAVTTGAWLSRFQSFLRITGEGARLSLNGATMIAGRQHADLSLTIEHQKPGAESRVLAKAVADGRGEGAFQGKIIVAPGAQKTDGKMMIRSLLLSEEASFAAKPELEIYADDVQCGHGATAGQIDKDRLFYFLARGIPRQEAERLLITAFLGEAVDALGDETLSAALMPMIDNWLARRGVAAAAAPG